MKRPEQVAVETVVGISQAEAWNAFTSPEAIMQWNRATPEWHCPSAQVDLRVGGAYFARMEARDGSMGFDFTGSYEEVDAPAAVTIRLEDGRRARTTFTPEGMGTRVRTVFDPEVTNPIEMQRDGWQAILDSYSAYVGRCSGGSSHTQTVNDESVSHEAVGRYESAAISGIPRRIVSHAVWHDHLEQIAEEEKALTDAHDRLAAMRRFAPWTRVSRPYRFVGPGGPADLQGLFAGRSQLIVYHHMLRPADPSPCEGCCMVGDQIPHIDHLHARSTSLVFVSKAPIAEIDSFRRRMGWAFPWFETADDFNADFGVTDGFGLNVFYRDGRDVYRTYFTTGRGVETLGTVWTLLDLTPLGRQETWEQSPEGTPQTEPYHWWRRHGEYDNTASATRACCSDRPK